MQQERNSERKRRLRESVAATMASLSSEDRLRSDEALRNAWFSLPQLAASETIFLYYGVGTEVDTRPLLRALAAQGKRVLLPRCLPKRQMEARWLRDEAELIPGVFGIPEPSERCPLVSKEEIDLILVPALCCDRMGYRLGKGGGYYDRYLANYSGLTVAFCRKLLLQESLPWEDFDQRVSLVLTEEGLVRSHTG